MLVRKETLSMFTVSLMWQRWKSVSLPIIVVSSGEQTHFFLLYMKNPYCGIIRRTDTLFSPLAWRIHFVVSSGEQTHFFLLYEESILWYHQENRHTFLLYMKNPYCGIIRRTDTLFSPLHEESILWYHQENRHTFFSFTWRIHIVVSSGEQTHFFLLNMKNPYCGIIRRTDTLFSPLHEESILWYHQENRHTFFSFTWRIHFVVSSGEQTHFFLLYMKNPYCGIIRRTDTLFSPLHEESILWYHQENRHTFFSFTWRIHIVVSSGEQTHFFLLYMKNPYCGIIRRTDTLFSPLHEESILWYHQENRHTCFLLYMKNPYCGIIRRTDTLFSPLHEESILWYHQENRHTFFSFTWRIHIVVSSGEQTHFFLLYMKNPYCGIIRRTDTLLSP